MGQSLSNVLLHIVFSTKNRVPLIDPEIETELYAYLITILASYGSYVHQIGGTCDHLHLFLTLPRTHAISDILEGVKKGASKWMKTKGEKYQGFAWQKGYGVFSVSVIHHESLKAYIVNQKEHHKKISFQDEYRKLLKQNNVPYDEKYVWD